MNSVSIVPDREVLANPEAIASLLELTRNKVVNNSILPQSGAFISPAIHPIGEKFLRDAILSPKSLLPEGSSKEVTEHALTLRMRIIACCLGLGKQVESIESFQLVAISPTVAYARFKDFVIILPSAIDDDSCEQRMLADLELLYEATGNKLKWIVDCSGLLTFSGLMFGNLIYFQDRLRDNNQALYIYWLRETLLSPTQMETLTRILSLVKIGGQYFSSDEV